MKADINDDSINEKLYKSGIIIAIIVPIAYAFYFIFIVGSPLSRNPSDWATFATFFTGIVSPIIALYILKLVAGSYFLQKREFKEANKAMQEQLNVVRKTLELQKLDSDGSKEDRNTQLKIDSLLRRQETCISFGDELSKLISTELGSPISTLQMGNLELSLDLSDKMFVEDNFQLNDVLSLLTSNCMRGDYDDIDSAPDPKVFINLILLLSQLNYLCKEVLNMDLQLKDLSPIFTDTVGQAFKQFAISKHNSLCHRLLFIRAIDKGMLDELFDDRHASREN